MPIYEYKCSKCAYEFEMIHGISGKDAKTACPECGAVNPQRMMSTFSCGGAQGSGSGASPSCAPRPSSRFK